MGTDASGEEVIFTIGHRESYFQAFRDHGHCVKRGRDALGEGDYPGGYAFRIRQDGERRIQEAYRDMEFAVFGLEADWGRDTEPSPEGWWHHLLCNAEVVLLEKS